MSTTHVDDVDYAIPHTEVLSTFASTDARTVLAVIALQPFERIAEFELQANRQLIVHGKAWPSAALDLLDHMPKIASELGVHEQAAWQALGTWMNPQVISRNTDPTPNKETHPITITDLTPHDRETPGRAAQIPWTARA